MFPAAPVTVTVTGVRTIRSPLSGFIRRGRRLSALARYSARSRPRSRIGAAARLSQVPWA